MCNGSGAYLDTLDTLWKLVGKQLAVSNLQDLSMSGLVLICQCVEGRHSFLIVRRIGNEEGLVGPVGPMGPMGPWGPLAQLELDPPHFQLFAQFGGFLSCQ